MTTTYTVTIKLDCDVCKDHNGSTSTYTGPNRFEAGRAAWDARWRYGPGIDICPECAADQKEEKP